MKVREEIRSLSIEGTIQSSREEIIQTLPMEVPVGSKFHSFARYWSRVRS